MKLMVGQADGCSVQAKCGRGHPGTRARRSLFHIHRKVRPARVFQHQKQVLGFADQHHIPFFSSCRCSIAVWAIHIPKDIPKKS